MLCEHCHENEATFHRVQVINGARSEAHLCSECLASQQGAINIGSMIASLFSPAGHVAPASQLACKRCGTTPARFQQTGRLGCEQCYSDLSAMIEPMLKRVQGRLRHTGRVPEGAKPSEPADPVQELRRLIQDAVAKEDYETAAQLRDEIKKYEKPVVDYEL